MPVAQLQPKEYVESVGLTASACSRVEALAYTRWLATHHYENFQVVSFLLPKQLHQDFYNVYAFCRWADDLGDEIGDTTESLRLLDWWRNLLEAMYQGHAEHPVFLALQETVDRHQIPQTPFADLIRAFEQDQVVLRYRTMEDVLGYCKYSANPVGHLVLYLCGYRDAERQRISDATCSGLQLANFWQDVTVDLQKDRIYLPLDLLAKHGYTTDELQNLRFNENFRALMTEAVATAERLFQDGMPLIRMVDRRLALDLELFTRGGLAILSKIRAQGYNVLERRPSISKAERVAILLRCLPRLLPF